jgi:lipopolysaccharide transport protein LptA
MPRWQRRARLALAVVFVGVIAAVLLVMRQRVPQAPPAVERLDPKAVSETRGGDVIQLKGERRDIRVEFANQISYEDGRTKLVAFKATIENRGGRSYVISGQEAWVGAEQSSYDVRGGVALRTSDGLVATTDHATFTEMEGILRGRGPVKFERGNMSGSGVGFTYDRQQDALWLLDKAIIRFAAAGKNAAMEVTAGTGGYSRQQRYARFERAVRMTRDNQVIEADTSTIFLQTQVDEPDRIELRGGSRITHRRSADDLSSFGGQAGGGSLGSLQSMQARDINLDYAPDGRTLEQSVLAGQSTIQLAKADGSTGQQLSAEFIDLSLAPDGAVTRLASRERVRMTLPSAADTPARVITSATLNATGESGKGLTATTFEGGAEFREASSRGGGSRVARAQTIKAQLGTNGTVDSAEFLTGFTFEDGRLKATSTDARYQVTKGVLTLASAKGSPDPHVEDERVTIDAPALEVTLSPRTMNASKGVRTVLSAGRRQQGERGTTLLKDNEPVNVSANELSFDEQAGRGEYTGKAVLFQGATSIKADSITLDDKQGDLTATGSVIAVLPIAGKTSKEGPSTSTGRAGEFRFLDAKRLAVFSKEAQLEGVQGNLHADRIELHLAPKDNTLDRLEAEGGTVRVVIEKREATGTQLTYLPADEQYKLVGSPVKLIESCRETTGRTLVFFRSSDKLEVDGNQEQRVQSKGNANCPESPRD